MQKIDTELLRKAREAATPQELATLAEENGQPLSKERAEELYARLHGTGEVADGELVDVSGGCGTDRRQTYPCPCGGTLVFDRAECLYICDTCGRHSIVRTYS